MAASTEYQYVLFDWDGCLARTFDVWLQESLTILGKNNIHATKDEVFAAFGLNGIMLNFDLPDKKARQSELVEAATKRLERVELYPGVESALGALRAVKKLAIVSDSQRHILDQGIAHNGLGAYFTSIVGRGEAGPIKPHPAGIEQALAEMGGSKSQAVMIGDSDKDIRAAGNAGIDSVLFYPAEHQSFYDISTLRSYGPTHIVHSFSELQTLLLNN
jgi:HAD superfamily hydrolase (TIGR01509 family)